MIVKVDLSKGELILGSARYAVSCVVRSLANGLRHKDEVVYSVSTPSVPYDPCPFPNGVWRVTGVEWQKDYNFSSDVYGPVKIRTNAGQPVKAWALDKDGDYLEITEKTVYDGGYLLHYSRSNTTLGCIRIGSPAAAAEIANIIEAVLDNGEDVILEVV